MFKKYTFFFLLLTFSLTNIAGTKPKCLVEPITNHVINLSGYDVVTVVYRITNQTKLTRTLTFKPVNGAIQTTVVPDSCPSPFTLAPNQSCNLSLLLSNQNASGASTEGPVICKTVSADDNRASPFLCSQPSPSDLLVINVEPRESANLYCWGNNNYGQLGTGSTVNSTFHALNVSTFSNPINLVSTGYRHSCAIDSLGDIFCWGRNNAQQLGLSSDITETNIPTNPVTNLPTTPLTVVAGNAHSCALLKNKEVMCWGSNEESQFGNGTHGGTSSIPQVTDLKQKAIQVEASDQGNCAILDDRSVKCWGNNKDSQTGQPSGSGPINTPQLVQNLDGPVVRLAGGGNHYCALLHSGEIQCWGNNNYGQLGTMSHQGSTTHIPQTVSGLKTNTTPVNITAGGQHSCVLYADGTAQCWGRNKSGQLGNSNNSGTETPTPAPQNVGQNNIVQLKAAAFSTCALLGTHKLKCWGSNTEGQLGNSHNYLTTHPNDTPFDVTNLITHDVIQLVDKSLFEHVCAITRN